MYSCFSIYNRIAYHMQKKVKWQRTWGVQSVQEWPRNTIYAKINLIFCDPRTFMLQQMCLEVGSLFAKVIYRSAKLPTITNCVAVLCTSEILAGIKFVMAFAHYDSWPPPVPHRPLHLDLFCRFALCPPRTCHFLVDHLFPHSWPSKQPIQETY